MHELLLASQSPRRRDILSSHGYEFQLFPIEVSEILNENLNFPAQICELAERKARAAAAAFKPLESLDYIILSADTVVVLDGEILGKPIDVDQAVEILGRLSGQTHDVYTAFCLLDLSRNQAVTDFDQSGVQFKKLSEKQIMDYINTGEPFDKAGAYGIQGEGRKLVEKFVGSFENIVGLPIEQIEKSF